MYPEIVFDTPFSDLNVKYTGQEYQLFRGDDLLDTSQNDCYVWQEGLTHFVRAADWVKGTKKLVAEFTHSSAVAVSLVHPIPKGKETYISLSDTFIHFTKTNKFFTLHDIYAGSRFDLLLANNELLGVSLGSPSGLKLVTASGYESPYLQNKSRVFWIGGVPVCPLTFSKNGEDKFAITITQAPNRPVAPFGYMEEDDEGSGMDSSMDPRCNLLFLEDGTFLFSKNVNSIRFFGKHCLVTRQGLTNIYSREQGFLSPVWFNHWLSSGDNQRLDQRIRKETTAIFLMLGEKFVILERDKPFSLFNEGTGKGISK